MMFGERVRADQRRGDIIVSDWNIKLIGVENERRRRSR